MALSDDNLENVTAAASADPLGQLNERVQQRQRLILAGASILVLGLASLWIFDGDEDVLSDPDAPREIEIATGDLVNRNLSQKEWIAASSNRLDTQSRQIKELQTAIQRQKELEEEIAALKQERGALTANAEATLAAYEAENQALRQAATEAQRAGGPARDPFNTAGRTGPAPAYGPGGEFSDQAGAMPDPRARPGQPGFMPISEAKILAFGGEGAKGDVGGQKIQRPEAAPVVVEDSPDYLPPNSYAPAKVIVGVDASAGVQSQTDPLPVVLRITGPARSVVNNGRVLTTRLEGCVVNGAARGDLSSEKVYVKLQKMTCDQPGGRTAVSEVKGFISFGGKAGVRGRIVSREGGLVTQAFLAGLAGGFGRGFSANANSVFAGSSISVDGRRDRLSTGEIIEGGLGQGVSEAGDMVSKYLIERAEQYQPIIEMPTGIDVEIVFLDGVYVRSTGQ